jgi:hypothetical protein
MDGGGLSRVFQIDGGVTASISELTISGGKTSGNGGGLANLGGTLTLAHCTVSGNCSAGSQFGDAGGLVVNHGTAQLAAPAAWKPHLTRSR